MSRLSDTTFPNPFFLAVKMRCITSMGIKIFTIDFAGRCVLLVPHKEKVSPSISELVPGTK